MTGEQKMVKTWAEEAVADMRRLGALQTMRPELRAALEQLESDLRAFIEDVEMFWDPAS